MLKWMVGDRNGIMKMVKFVVDIEWVELSRMGIMEMVKMGVVVVVSINYEIFGKMEIVPIHQKC